MFPHVPEGSEEFTDRRCKPWSPERLLMFQERYYTQVILKESHHV